MPTYEYLCDNCEHRFEKFQMMSASPLKKCPECGKMKLKRLLGTGAGIIFKGSGFYETDYRSSSYKAGQSAAKTTSSSDSSSSASASTSTETKKPEKPKKESKTSTSKDKKSA